MKIVGEIASEDTSKVDFFYFMSDCGYKPEQVLDPHKSTVLWKTRLNITFIYKNEKSVPYMKAAKYRDTLLFYFNAIGDSVLKTLTLYGSLASRVFIKYGLQNMDNCQCLAVQIKSTNYMCCA